MTLVRKQLHQSFIYEQTTQTRKNEESLPDWEEWASVKPIIFTARDVSLKQVRNVFAFTVKELFLNWIAKK